MSTVKLKSVRRAFDESVEKLQGRIDGTIRSMVTSWPRLNAAGIDGLEFGTVNTIAAMSGVGKCLGKGTKVMMYDGTFKRVEDIRTGDVLMGPDSTPRNVLSTATGTEQMYWVRQDKGIDYRVNESHILSLVYNMHQKRRIVNLPVTKVIELQKTKSFDRMYRGYRAGRLTFPKQTEPEMDPYMMGLYLADGSVHKAEFTLHDDDTELHDAVYEYSTAGVTVSRNSKKSSSYYVRSNMVKDLRKCGFYKNGKFVPESVKYGSVNTRLEFLAGYIDGDGHLVHNSYEIAFAKHDIAEDIAFIARSLGFRTSVSDKVVNGTVYKRMHICSSNNYVSDIPVRLERKRASIPIQVYSTCKIRIEKDVIDEYYGFTIDGDHLFLLEDQTVTHNTALANRLVFDAIELNQDLDIAVLFFTVEMPAWRLVDRFVSSVLGIPVKEIPKTDDIVKRVETEIKPKLARADIQYVEYMYSPKKIVEIAKQFCKSRPNKYCVIVYDHSLLIKRDSNVSERQALINLANEFNMTKKQFPNSIYFVISQLNRDIENPERIKNPALHFPKKSDIFGSDALYQASDVVLVMHDPSKLMIQNYGPKRYPTASVLFIHLLKVREGKLGLFVVKNHAHVNRFPELDKSELVQYGFFKD